MLYRNGTAGGLFFAGGTITSASQLAVNPALVNNPALIAASGTASRSYFEIGRATSSRSISGVTVINRPGRATESTGACGSPVISRRKVMVLTSFLMKGSST